jgi:hypothetical protein
MRILPAIMAGVFLVGLVLAAGGQDPPGGSLTESEEIAEMNRRIEVLEESLALSQTEADYFHQKWVEVRLRNEALGIEALSANERALEEKVIRLVGELFRSEKNRRALEQTVQDLIRTGRELHGASPLERGQRRAEYEVAVRKARVLIEQRSAGLIRIADSFRSGMVTDFNQDLNVAILNFGRGQGAEVGMPFRILRGDRVIGRGRIIEVREYLSALMVEDLVKETEVQAGDRVLLETIR